MGRRDRNYSRYTREKHKTDSIYNIMVYQIFIALAVFIGIYIAASSQNAAISNFVEEIKATAGTNFNINILDDNGNFNFDYIETVLGIEDTEGKGGFNPFNRIGDARLVQAPAGSSLAPILVSSPLAVPVGGKITSKYGYRINPITKTDDFHRGIDIAAPKGTVIKAPLMAYVLEVGKDKINGNYIKLDHGSGLVTLYAHCNEIIAKQGTRVKKGERIAKVGSTGYSTGPHLHYEILANGITYNPAWLYDFT